MDYYFSKLDISTYSPRDIDILKEHFGITETGNDLLWILAIKIINLHLATFNKSRSKEGVPFGHPLPWSASVSGLRSAQMKKSTLDMSMFNQILGAGGFGIVIKKQDSNIVGKFLINPESCNEAEIEYNKHLKVYNAFKQTQALTNKYPNLCISKPLDFNNQPTTVLGKTYTCYYLMTELYPVNKNGLYHIISDQEFYKGLFNKLVGRIYDEPISDENPSRGFFGTYDYIDENILQKETTVFDVPKMLQFMGYAFGVILFIAELLPRDVEYVLGRDKAGHLCFTVLDFGLTESVNYNENPDMLATLANQAVHDLLDIDIYFPTTEKLIDFFKAGLTDAFNVSSGSAQKKLVYQGIMDNWTA